MSGLMKSRVFKRGVQSSARMSWLLVLPFLMGAYWDSCNKPTVGFYPNYPAVLPKEPKDVIAHTAAQNAKIKGTTLFINWDDRFYDCTSGPCLLAQSKVCPMGTEIACYLEGFLDPWVVTKTATPPGEELNLSLVIQTHTTKKYNNWKIGPSFVRSMQMAPADMNKMDNMNNNPVHAEFENFYGEIYSVLSQTKYAGATYLISLGNEVNLYLGNNQDAWNAYISFAESEKTFIQNHTGVAALVGVSTTFFNGPIVDNVGIDGAWDPINVTWGGNINNILKLNQHTNALIFTYYPVDARNNYWALRPDRVANDFLAMAYVSYFIQNHPKIVLQEVGYPTDKNLHGYGNAFPLYSDKDGLTSQQQFVQNLFTQFHQASQGPYAMRALSWWSLFDVGDPNNPSGICADLFGSDPSALPIREAYCTNGLFDSAGNPKPAWNHDPGISTGGFKDHAAEVPTWYP